MQAGDQVRLRVTGGPAPAVRCAAVPDTWQQVFELARFARGLGTAPAFPDEFSIAIGEERHLELSADEAADPESWVQCSEGECHSALAALVEMLTRPIAADGAPAPYLVVTDDPPENPSTDKFGRCLTPDPYEQALPYHRPTYLYVAYPLDGVPRLCPPAPVVQIGWTEERRIGGVRLRLASDERDVADPTEPTAERQEAADAFVAWARGNGPAPPFADRVRLIGPGFHPAFVDEPENRSVYSGCSGLGFPDCGIDPVAAIYHAKGPIVVSDGAACASSGGLPPRLSDASADQVRLATPTADPADCAALVVLWIRNDGVVYAVGLAGVPG